jgi:hypothetical protein
MTDYQKRIFEAAVQIVAASLAGDSEVTVTYAVAAAVQIDEEVCRVARQPLCDIGTVAVETLNARLKPEAE